MVWLATSQGTEEGGYDLSPPPPSLAPRRRTRNTLNQPVACRAASSLFTSITNSCRFTIVQIVINILTVMIEWKSGIVAGIVQVEAVM